MCSHPLRAALVALALTHFAATRAADENLPSSGGQALFAANCAMCHGATGDGIKDVYPPLAKSDFLAANRSTAIRALVAGLNNAITVNGHAYRGQMPPIMLDDAQAAEVLTFVLNSWGNPGGRVTTDEVKEVRATTDFHTYADLQAAADYRPLPAPPPGFTIRELVRLPDFGVRLASDPQRGRVYVLGKDGGVWRFEVATGNLKQIIWPDDFTGRKPGGITTLGFVRDEAGRLWITVNQRVDARPLVLNECGIYRTSNFDADGDPVAPRPWLRTSYPWGIGPYNHGLSDIRFGRDGMLYVSSGSRTDAGETGQMPWLGTMGEVDITATMWRLDPRAATTPRIEIIARGIRNAFSFAWDGAGNLFTVSNGPDAHAAEEMDCVVPPRPGEPPRHHGFPYQFADAPADHKWYAHTPVPPPPAGVQYVLPVVNLGPAATMDGKPTSTFNPHSSPTGLTWLGPDWPESVRNGFLMGRFGSLLSGPGEDEEHGFDVLHLKLERRGDTWVAHTTQLLAPLGRPIDIHVAAAGKIYILEYTRSTKLKNGAGWLPGRILELAVEDPNRTSPAAR